MDSILMYYIRINQHLSQKARRHFGKLNLTFPQATALNVLGAEGPMPISKLAELTGSADSTISGIVDRLERLGLAQRTRSELDHRVIYVEVSEQYRQLRNKAETGVNEYFDTLLDTLKPEERDQIQKSLQLLDRVLEGESQQS